MASGIIPTAMIWKFVPTLSLVFLILIYIAVSAIFTVAWTWVFFEWPAELKKKLPISSEELRRRKKEFYDSLPR